MTNAGVTASAHPTGELQSSALTRHSLPRRTRTGRRVGSLPPRGLSPRCCQRAHPSRRTLRGQDGALVCGRQGRGARSCCGDGSRGAKLRGGLGTCRQDPPGRGSPALPLQRSHLSAAVVGPAAVYRQTSTLRRKLLRRRGGDCWRSRCPSAFIFLKNFFKKFVH